MFLILLHGIIENVTYQRFAIMQKISTYLYPNRIELLIDSTPFSVEYTNVYQRNVKIYQGIDNIIEFDIKNADQKRIDLHTISDIEMTVMDQSGNELPTSPYPISVSNLRGIGTVIIPREDLANLSDQYLRYSVSAIQDNHEVLLYADTRFSAVSTIEFLTQARPKRRSKRIFKSFIAEIDYRGNPIYHSSAIPVTFYEAVPTTRMNFSIYVKGFVGSIWLEATTRDAITHESFKSLGKPWGSWNRSSTDGTFTGLIPYGTGTPVGEYTYMRVSFQTPSINGLGASFKVTNTGTSYLVEIDRGGTGYSNGSVISVPGSQIGGQDTTNDLLITVTGLDTGGSGMSPNSYRVSSINGITWSGVAGLVPGTYMVTGTNYTGVVDRVEVF